LIRVAIADDHDLIREGFARLVSREEDMSLVAEAETAGEAIEMLKHTVCDVLVLDLALPDSSGLETLKDVRHRFPDVAVLMLSMHAEEQYALRSLQNGASGYVTKGRDSRILIEAIRKAASGGRYVSPSLAERLADELTRKSNRLPHEALSDRELEVLILIGHGVPTGEIADRLSLSTNTVQTYRRRIREKLEARSNADLVRYAVNHDLLV
jgi:DNA-binding NarL/FixJ family response regulator